MKINIDKKVINFTPENERETIELERLWRILVGCVTETKKISPIGEYIPSKKNTASFYIEGDVEYDAGKAYESGVYYCAICNKSLTFEVGDEIPMCCGRFMELID